MPYNLLALDLDGTLIGADLLIPAIVKAEIARIQAQGVHVTLATGRTFASTRPFAKELDLRDAVICYQGAVVRHPVSDVLLDHTPMPDAVAGLVQTLLGYDLCVLAFVDDQITVAGHRRELDEYLAFHPEEEPFVVPDLVALVASHPTTKVLFVAEPERVTAVLAEVGPLVEGSLAALRSHAIFGEFTALGVSKGAALARMAARLGIPREQVVAIGDQENDLSMITWAGLGLAMGNAIPAVKAAAADILPTVQQAGVASAIQRLFPVTAVL